MIDIDINYEGLPENMRIETAEQLREILKKRIADDDGTRYDVDELRVMIDKTRLRDL